MASQRSQRARAAASSAKTKKAARRKRAPGPDLSALPRRVRRLSAWFRRDGTEAKPPFPDEQGVWVFDEDDYLLLALLNDTVYCAELLGQNPANHDYGGCYTVWDYQYPLFRTDDPYAGFACARSVGKTESIKWRAIKHAFKRLGQNLLLTAPELIHLLPLTDAVEDRIRDIRLLREFLRVEGGKTGFTHRPFGVDFADGTKIVGRIPRLTGTGVKGQHQPDLIIDEAQDYPAAGWTEVHETVMKDTVDRAGNPDFTYHFYGVHSGARDSGFHARMSKGGFKIINITAMQRPGWGKEEKEAARAAYGGSAASDYRRNILGEAGGASSPFFVTARLVACMDNDRESTYNTQEIIPTSFRDPDGGLFQRIRVEEFDELGLPMSEVIDLPGGYKEVWGGMDLGLTNSPTVITLFARQRVKVGKTTTERLKLIRRIHLERMRTKQIREALYAIGYRYGTALKGFGTDITGLGFPIFQEMEDDEACPQHLKDVHRGYFFNAKVAVDVEPTNVTRDEAGRMRNHLGQQVEEDVDPNTGNVRYVTHMPMIEASTRFLREMVDSTFLLLPFDVEVTGDMLGETDQRVKRIAGLKQKPNAFHILDSMRAMAMVYRGEDVERQLTENVVPVMDVAAQL